MAPAWMDGRASGRVRSTTPEQPLKAHSPIGRTRWLHRPSSTRSRSAQLPRRPPTDPRLPHPAYSLLLPRPALSPNAVLYHLDRSHERVPLNRAQGTREQQTCGWHKQHAFIRASVVVEAFTRNILPVRSITRHVPRAPSPSVCACMHACMPWPRRPWARRVAAATSVRSAKHPYPARAPPHSADSV